MDNIVDQVKVVYQENVELVRKNNELAMALNKIIELRKVLSEKSKMCRTETELYKLMQSYINEEGKILHSVV